MRILLLNTSGGQGVAALADETGVLAAEMLPGRGMSEELMPALERLFARTGWVPGDLEAVGVVVGPGSFTGVRVGLSAVKGLCEGLGIRMVGMSRLALVAGDSTGERSALLDAGRGEYFCGIYRESVCVREGLVTEVEARELMLGRVAVSCEARVAERLGVGLVPEPGAEAMLKMFRRRADTGDWTDVAMVDANYLRRTDAELKRLATVG
jgi:tRNA threonylcarbamoyladenosine biosynthesis protein TsaB